MLNPEPKPGKDISTPEGWRSIALAEAASKGIARAMRERMLPAFQKIASVAQCGASKGCPIEYPSHIVRAYVQAANVRAVSGGVLFIDGKSAYYSTLRELLFDGSALQDADKIRAMLVALHPEQSKQDELFAILMGPGLLKEAGTPEGICGYLQAAMSNSWFSLQPGSGICFRTRTGTVPGTPLADLLYQEIQTIFLDGLRLRLRELQLQVRSFTGRSEGSMPCWADDLAVFLPYCTASNVIGNLRAVVSEADHCSRNTGVMLNFDANKTEALVIFKGEGSVAARLQHLTSDEPSVEVELKNGQVAQLRLVKQYDHLGGRVCYHGKCLEDVKRRAGLAEAVFKKFSRTLLRNRELEPAEKVNLLRSLVLRKFLFGAGLWTLQTRAEWQAFSSTVMGFLRRCVRPIYGFGSPHLSDEDVCAVLEVLTPAQLYKVEVIRQLRVVALQGQGFLWETLCDGGSWLECAFSSLDAVLGVLGDDWCLTGSWQCKLESLRTRVEQLRSLPGRFSHFTLQARREAREQVLLKAVALRALERSGGLIFTVAEVGTVGVHGCRICAAFFKTAAAKAAHEANRHGLRAPSTAAVFGTRCERCACEYWSSERLRRHLSGSPECLNVYLNSDVCEPVGKRDRRDRAWRPVVRTEGPQPFWATLAPRSCVIQDERNAEDVFADDAAQQLTALVDECGSGVSLSTWFKRVLVWMAHYSSEFEGFVTPRKHPWHELLQIAFDLKQADFQVLEGTCRTEGFSAEASDGCVYLLPLDAAVAA